MLGTLLRHFISPPPMPPIELPVPLRYMPAVKQAVTEVCKGMYYSGAMDGFACGMCLATAIILGLSLRLNLFKNAANAISSL